MWSPITEEGLCTAYYDFQDYKANVTGLERCLFVQDDGAALFIANGKGKPITECPLPQDVRICREVSKETVVAEFVAEVNAKAYLNIRDNGMVSGAHWNALKSVCKDWGIKFDEQPG